MSDFDIRHHREVVAWYKDNPVAQHLFPSKERYYSDKEIEELDKDYDDLTNKTN